MLITDRIKNIFKKIEKKDLNTDLISTNEWSANFPTGNPDDHVRSISEYQKIYDTPIVNLCENVLRAGIVQTPWIIQGEDLKLVEYIQNVYGNLNIRALSDGLLDSRTFGYGVAEKILELKNNIYEIVDIKFKKPENFQFKTDKYGSLASIRYSVTGEDFEDVNMDKFIVSTWPGVKFGNYYGKSEYYNLYGLINRFNDNENTLQKALKFLLVKPLIHYFNSELDDDAIKKIKAAVGTLANSSLIHIPAGRNAKTDILEKDSIIEVLGNRSEPRSVDPMRSEIDREETMIKLMLGVPLDLLGTTTGGGSYARAKTQYLLYTAKVEQMQGWLEEIHNKQIITPLIKLNFREQKEYPKFKYQESDEGTTAAKASIIAELVRTGVIKGNEGWIREYLGLPESDIEPVPAPAPEPIPIEEPNAGE